MQARRRLHLRLKRLRLSRPPIAPVVFGENTHLGNVVRNGQRVSDSFRRASRPWEIGQQARKTGGAQPGSVRERRQLVGWVRVGGVPTPVARNVTQLRPSKSGGTQTVFGVKVRFCGGAHQTAEQPGVFSLSCGEAIPSLFLPFRTQPSREPHRSLAVAPLIAIRGATARLRWGYGGVSGL